MSAMPDLRPRAARLALKVALGVVGPAALAACGSGGGAVAGHGSSTTSVPAAPTTSQAPATTTAPTTSTTTPAAPPPDLQPSSEQASAALMDAWMAADRAKASAVAAPEAVAALFATPYAGQPLNDRGCTDAFPPIECTWGPYAGGSGSIYQVAVTQTPGGWYASAVMVES